jgi:23S rRNA (uracil1939-C5)-methyltransferase
LRLTIEKLVYGGDGLGRLPGDERGPGKAVFVPFVLEGESVEVTMVDEKPGFARASLEKVAESSAERTPPRCPYFQRCGGCHYQHASYEHQLQIKAAILKETLRRVAKLELPCELGVHASPPWNYRNRTRLKIRTQPQFSVGYYRFNSHELLPVEECPISSPLINRAIGAVWQMGRAGKLDELAGDIEFFANTEDDQLLVEVHASGEMRRRMARVIADELHGTVPQCVGVVVFRASQKLAETGEEIFRTGSGEMTYRTAEASYRVSAGAFFQINRHLTSDLVRIVTAGASGHTALDLYAGVGLFSTVLSKQFDEVIAVESSPLSYRDLEYNSPVNVKAVQAMAGQYLKNISGKLRPDLVVVDPPRSGLGDAVVHSLMKAGAPRMTYVSCDPATLSRDLVRLLAAGYRIEQARLVDLFPQTYHMESVFHLVI